MKKLLVTAIGAAAALGAFAAGEISLLRFEDMERGGTTISALNTAQGTYWSADQDATNNTYEIVERAEAIVARQETAISQAPTNALSVKTTFGKPLSVNVVDGGTATNINAGLYFDSLVKFTVCEDEPVTTNYNGAKIVMWLQEEYNGDDIVRTNLMVNAGYLTVDQNVLQVSNAVYNCGEIAGDFADKFHRVTIKAIGNITTGNTPVPGFAIYIDGSDDAQIGGLPKGTSEAKWDSSFTAAYTLTEAAADLASSTKGALFPSLDQSSPAMSTLTAASFDGTGSLSDIIFTANAPDFAKDYAAPKVSVTVNNSVLPPYSSFDEAITFVNAQSAGTTVHVMLLKGMTIDSTLAFASAANVTLDFAGVVLTNESASAAAISNGGLLTITNSIEGVGGIYCASTGAALTDNGDGMLNITAGSFVGHVGLVSDGTYSISGGSFLDDTDFEGINCLAAGKAFVYNDTTGLWDVVTPTYTVTFVHGIYGQNTNAYDNLASGAEMPTAPDASVAGWNYVWVPSPIDSVVTSNATYTAQYTAINYEIKFVYGLEKEETNTVSATYYQSVSVPVDSTNIVGYTVAWTPEIANGAVTVTHDQTYEATYTPNEYTITFVAEGGTVDPASTNYTIESGAITLPTASHSGGIGLQFGGWTNETMTITTEDLTFTPTTANLGSFTLYAKWTAGGPTYPTYLDNATAEVKAKYLTWADTYGTDDSSQYEAAFLLNVAPNGDTTLDATAVTISGTTVTIAIDHANVNGYPYVKKAATVAGLASAPKTQVTIVPADNIDNGGVVTLTGESGDAQFYQIGVQAEAINQN